MGVDPVEDRWRHVLNVEAKPRLHLQDQGRRRLVARPVDVRSLAVPGRRSLGFAARARRPLQPLGRAEGGDPLADIKRAARKENHRLVVKRGQVARDNRAAFVPAARRVAAE